MPVMVKTEPFETLVIPSKIFAVDSDLERSRALCHGQFSLEFGFSAPTATSKSKIFWGIPFSEYGSRARLDPS